MIETRCVRQTIFILRFESKQFVLLDQIRLRCSIDIFSENRSASSFPLANDQRSMNYYSLSILVLLLLLLFFTDFCSTSSWRKKASSLKNGSYITRIRHRFHSNDEDTVDENGIAPSTTSIEPDQRSAVVVLTSLSGIYIWWPTIFGGDDSFHLLLNQEDVPRFHDVAGDRDGNIYLTAPHERTVYQLKYSEGWWIANFSNHSVMNSIRSEMPLFVSVHYISSILYVYGHSDIQMIDLLQRPRTRGSAPFMKRLRELSPNLRISDLVIDQLTSEGYIIGDSFGWCTIIRCSLTVNECFFLFKIPSSYDNRPYPCTATIDFSSKIIYLSLEEKILAVHLNEGTSYDRRTILAEKRGPRSTLGYDDIVVYRDAILYTDVLRPLLHLCTSPLSNPCLNITLEFSSPQRTILPLRLSVVEVNQLRPPTFDDEDHPDQDHIDQLHLNQSTTIPGPLNLIGSNQSKSASSTSSPSPHHQIPWTNISMLLFGFVLGFIVSGLAFMIYYILCNKNRPRIKQDRPSPPDRSPSRQISQLPSSHQSSGASEDEEDHSTSIDMQFAPASPLLTPPTNGLSPGYSNLSSIGSQSEATEFTTTSSSSYDPTIVL